MTAEREELAGLIREAHQFANGFTETDIAPLAAFLVSMGYANRTDTLEEAAKHVERIFAHLTRIADPDTLNTAKAVLAPVIDAIRALKGM